MLAPVFGLILTGGESVRMGSDKAEICYNTDQQPQWKVLRELLDPFCDKTFFSCTEKQKTKWSLGDSGLIDKIPGHGPASGLHTAFTFYPEMAWLVVGCDYPFLERQDIEQLLKAREEKIPAVSFFNETKNEMEPMITLWEPHAGKEFLAAFLAGDDSPRRTLKRLNVKVIMPRDARVLLNVNE